MVGDFQANLALMDAHLDRGKVSIETKSDHNGTSVGTSYPRLRPRECEQSDTFQVGTRFQGLLHSLRVIVMGRNPQKEIILW
jgi:hypothetical protein